MKKTSRGSAAKGTVAVIGLGISIGVARADGPLSDSVLASADRAMLVDKARRHRRRALPTRN